MKRPTILLALILTGCAHQPVALAAGRDVNAGHVMADTSCFGQGCDLTVSACRLDAGGVTPEFQLCSDSAREVSWNGSIFDIVGSFQADGITSQGNLTISAADPAVIFDPATATDTEFWVGVTEDAGSDDDDLFQIGDGTTPGTNPFMTLTTEGHLGLGTISPGNKVHVVSSTSANLQVEANTGSGILWTQTNGAVDEKYFQSIVFGGVFQMRGLTDSLAVLTSNFTIDLATGDHGIGTSTPSALLDVDAGTGTGTVEVDGSTGGCLQVRDTDDGGWLYLTALDGELGISDVSCGGTISMSSPVVFAVYDPEPARTSETNIFGGLIAEAAGETLTAASPANAIVGIGKVLIVVNAGADTNGTATVTCDTINRSTGAETAADTMALTIAGTTTDATTTDTNGNNRWDFTGAYITPEWCAGTVAVTTADLDISDLDFYSLAFNQLNDRPAFSFETLDVTLLVTNSAADFDMYCYGIRPATGNKADVDELADIHVGADGEAARAGDTYRLRRGNLSEAFDGTDEGFLCQSFYNATANVEDVSYVLEFTVP